MKAIRTRYSGPTNTRGSRIHATDSDGNRVSIACDSELGREDLHRRAAYKLMEKMRWPNILVNGGFGHDEYWVMMPCETGQVPGYELFIPAEERAK